MLRKPCQKVDASEDSLRIKRREFLSPQTQCRKTPRRKLDFERLELRQLLASDCGPDNLLLNCGFEDAQAPALPPAAEELFQVIPAGSNAIAHWEPFSHPGDPDGNVDWVHDALWITTEGDRSIDLSGTPGRGGVRQTFATVPNVRYNLDFDMAGNPFGRLHPDGSNPLKVLRVSAAGQSQEFSYTVSPTANGSDLRWETKNWSFIANSTTTTLAFLAVGPDPDVDTSDEADFGATIDRVHLTRATTGSIHGAAYHDLNGDGNRSPGEPGLDGKRIHLLDTSDTIVTLDGAVDTNPIFGGSGGYVFAEIPPSTYRVHELAWSGYVSTLPANNVAGTIGFYDFEFLEGQVLGGIDFPNAAPGSIHGFKFEDLNANGVYEANIDRPQEGVQFVLTGVTGLGVSIDLTTTTNAEGMFEFVGLMPSVEGAGAGTGYTVTEVVPAGFANTTPNPFHADLYSGTELVAFTGQAMLPVSVTVPMSGGLRGDRGDAERMAGPFFTDIQPGDYKLTLVSSDNPPHGTQNQLNEQYFIRAWDAANILVLDSPPIGDLPNHLSELTQVVANRISLPSGVARIEAFHISARTGVGGVNSIMPVRAIFENLDPRIERPDNLFFGNAPTSSIHGQKFRDQDADGQRDPGEPGLNGWTIQLVDSRNDVVVQEQITHPQDGDSGWFWFTDVPPGEYEIREVAQAGWSQTYPENDMHRLEIGFNETITGIDFGNSKLASIHGTKIEDLDGDGVRDDGEPGLNGWTVQLVDASGQVVQEQLTHSENDEPGQFWFNDVAPGSYEIREEARPGWRQTFPASDSYSITVGLEQTIEELDFGNTVLGSIHGFKFNDVDGDGNYDPQIDVPSAGVEFRLRGTNGLGDVVAQAAETDERGEFWFTGLSPSVQGEGGGTGYGVVEKVPPGTEPTTPPVFITDLSSRQELVAFEGQAMLPENDPRIEVVLGTDLMFGNREITSEIHGFKFEDLDKDGVYDANEPGMGGVVIYVDHDGSGRREFDEMFVETAFDDPATPENETGSFWFTGLPAGTFVVAEESPRGYEQSFPAEREPYVVELAAGEIATGLLFGNKDATNFGNARLGDVHGRKIHDLNANGEHDPNEPGLAGVTIRLTANDSDIVYEAVSMDDDPATAIDETGMFWFVDVVPGSYTLQEVLPPDWFNTFPGPDGQQVFVGSNEIVDGLLIGNAQFASIHGLKYNDQNGNGQRDPNEPGVPGIVIYADLNRNGMLEAGEPAARTMADDPATAEDETGRFWLENLRPGDYSIREVITEDDVVQTSPGGELQGHDVTLTSGQVLTGVDFGNAHLCNVHGWKWEDLNLNGRIDPNEPGVAGVTIYADLNRNGELDLGEPSTLSMEDDPTTPRDETGQFWLEGLLPGEYLIREIVPEGWVNVFPAGSHHLVVLQDCGHIGPSAIQIPLTAPSDSEPPIEDDGETVPVEPIPNDSAAPTPAMDALTLTFNDQQDEATPAAPELVPAAPQLIPTAPELIPTVPELIPTVPELIPTVPELIPTVPELAPLVPTVRLVQVDLDVSSDGTVSEDDVRLIMHDIQQNGMRESTRDANNGVQRDRFDVNRDGWVTPMDVLLVINALVTSADEPGGSSAEITSLERPFGLFPDDEAPGDAQAIRADPSEVDASSPRAGSIVDRPESFWIAEVAGENATSSPTSREVAFDELSDDDLSAALLDDELLHDLLL